MKCDNCKKHDDCVSGNGLTWPCGAYAPLVATNAECIRSMSNQQLVRLIVHTVADGCPPEMDWECAKDFSGWEGCEKCWAKWLKRPAQEPTSEALLGKRGDALEQLADLEALWDMYGGEEGVTIAFQKAAERDAAVEELRGICWCCANAKPWMDAFGGERFTTCEYIREQGVLARGGGKCKCPHWEWRGPRAEEA